MTKTDSKTTRRLFIGAGLGVAAAGGWWLAKDSVPADDTDDSIPATDSGVRLLQRFPAIDVHSHPARSFLANGEFEDPAVQAMGYGSEAARLIDMQAGHVTASLFAIVADVQVLGISREGGIQAYRDFRAGEAYDDFNRQLNHFASLGESGVLSFALSSEDILTAHDSGESIAVLSCEGADFIEDKLERLESAYNAGVRSIGIVHYRPNEYGDTQTAEPVHNGLTALGAEVVQEMNRQGMLIDLAHATFQTTRDTVEISRAPVMLSHSHLVHDTITNPRLINRDHANLIAASNGVIGAWPAGISSKTMTDFIDEIFRLIDQVGIDHVAVGTDLDANYKPVLTDYAQFPVVATALLDRGLSENEAGQILGVNFLRVLNDVANQRQA